MTQEINQIFFPISPLHVSLPDYQQLQLHDSKNSLLGIFSVRNTLSPVSTSFAWGSHDLSIHVPLNPILQLWVGKTRGHVDYSKQVSPPSEAGRVIPAL